MKIAYFVNDQPKPSHTFIRREVLAIERLGQAVTRYALRGWSERVVDPDDIAEQQRTHYVLRGGLLGLAWTALRFTVKHPLRMHNGLRRAVQVTLGGDRTWMHHLVSLAEACQLVEWFARDEIDHVHAHFGTNSAEVVMLARALGGPTYSFTVHGADEWDMPRQLKLREKLEHAAFVVAISSFTRAQMARWARPEDRAKIHVVHCGLEESALSQAPTPVPDNRRIVCVGRLCVEKGQDTLVEAVAELLHRGVPATLELVGDGPLRPRIESLIRTHGLSQHVVLSGLATSAQVFEKLRNARLMALPSTSEGLPVVLMEALALGRPVVTTYVAGIPELIRDGEEGFLIPSGDVHSLVDALERALSMPVDELTRMAQRGNRRVRDRHSVDVEARKLLDLFRRAHAVGEVHVGGTPESASHQGGGSQYVRSVLASK